MNVARWVLLMLTWPCVGISVWYAIWQANDQWRAIAGVFAMMALLFGGAFVLSFFIQGGDASTVVP